MRIGIDVACWSNRRGFGRFVRELVPAVVAQGGGDDRFVLFADRQTAEGSRFPQGCRVVVGQTSEAATRGASADGRRSLRDMWAMRRVVGGEKLDVMFFPAVYSFFPVPRSLPCVVTFHDVIAETLPHLVFTTRRSRFFWNLKSRLALRVSRKVLTVSQASKRGLMEHFGLAEDRVRVVSEAPGEAFGSIGRREDSRVLGRYGIEAGQRYLMYVGGISPHKNLDTLIEAFAVVAGEAGLQDVRLVLVGDYAGDSFRTCYQQLSGLVERLGLKGRVDFPGFVPDEDLGVLYSGSEAFVFPSYLEGFGLPAVEAMSCGAAVLASDRGSLPEVLGGAGELFDPRDRASMAGAMRRVLTDKTYRDDLRRRSLSRARDFSWERAGREAIDVLHEVGRLG